MCLDNCNTKILTHEPSQLTESRGSGKDFVSTEHQCLMALDTTVSFHENPLEKVAIWERRLSYDLSKHRERPSTIKSADKGDIIVIRNSDQESKAEEYNRDYCVITAASKPPSQSPIRPSVLSSHTASLRLSSRNYESFAKRHLGGEVISPQQTITTQPLPHSASENDRSECRSLTKNPNLNDIQKLSNADVKIFCCGRDVEQVMEYCTCLCCVKGLFYHCTKDSYAEGSIAEKPCACTPVGKNCVKRWTCLGVCSIFLPCLLCYIPAKGCLNVGKNYKQHRYSTVQLSNKNPRPRRQNEIDNL